MLCPFWSRLVGSLIIPDFYLKSILEERIRMKKIPVTTPYFGREEEIAACEAIRSGWVAQGPKVGEFERKIADHEKVKEGVAVTSCTAALHLAMVASGMGEGMDVLAPAFTFVATTNAIVSTGALPVLVDIDSKTYNIDVHAVEKIIEEKYVLKSDKLYNKETGNILWGIVPVHEFGLCCNIKEINRIAQRYNLLVIEDAACALGAQINGIHEGAFGNTSCISFHPRKSITTGEGGMILTDDARLASRMRELRSHGCSISADARDKSHGFLLPEYNEAGYNYRMTDIQAAIGIEQAKRLDYIIGQKRKKAELYNRLIGERIPELSVPYVPDGYFHTYQSYVCMLNYRKLGVDSIEDGGRLRNQLLEKLENIEIATRQGTHAIHMLGYYKNRFGYTPEDYINAYAADRLSITLPLYVQLQEDEQEYVIDMFRRALDEVK